MSDQSDGARIAQPMTIRVPKPRRRTGNAARRHVARQRLALRMARRAMGARPSKTGGR